MHILCVLKQARFSITNSYLEEDEKEEEEGEEEEEEEEEGEEEEEEEEEKQEEEEKYCNDRTASISMHSLAEPRTASKKGLIGTYITTVFAQRYVYFVV